MIQIVMIVVENSVGYTRYLEQLNVLSRKYKEALNLCLVC